MTELQRVIDPTAFSENLGLFDNETITEVIDIFISEYPERIKSIQQSITDNDPEQTRFHAHGLKGIIANFGAPHPLMYIRQVEELARKGDIPGLLPDFETFKSYGDQLIAELGEIRKNLTAK